MSPIPPPEKKDKSPVLKAIEALIEETQRNGSAVIDGVIVHPSDVPVLKELLEESEPYVSRSGVRSTLFGQPLTVSTAAPPLGGALTEAWRKQVEAMKNNPPPLIAGRPQPLTYKQAVAYKGQNLTGISFDETKTVLEQQLEDSLWAMATLHTPVFTKEMLYDHVGPGHMEDTWYVKKVYPSEVHLLCKCRVILVLARCRYDWEDETGLMRQCEEPAYPPEATLKKDARCGQHMGTQKGKA
jgi:hypothetical protein